MKFVLPFSFILLHFHFRFECGSKFMSSLSHITIGNVAILGYRYNEILLQLNTSSLLYVHACVVYFLK